MDKRVEKIVQKLDMKPHPEGGFFKETYRSNGVIPKEALSDGFDEQRNYCTAIYFLLTADIFSAFHRIKQDEIWHFYEGNAIDIHVIDTQGVYTKHTVGMNIDDGEFPQLVVPAGAWFASGLSKQNGYALVGCTVAPGFDFADFELAERTQLIRQYSQYEDVITRFTRV